MQSDFRVKNKFHSKCFHIFHAKCCISREFGAVCRDKTPQNTYQRIYSSRILTQKYSRQRPTKTIKIYYSYGSRMIFQEERNRETRKKYWQQNARQRRVSVFLSRVFVEFEIINLHEQRMIEIFYNYQMMTQSCHRLQKYV